MLSFSFLVRSALVVAAWLFARYRQKELATAYGVPSYVSELLTHEELMTVRADRAANARLHGKSHQFVTVAKFMVEEILLCPRSRSSRQRA